VSNATASELLPHVKAMLTDRGSVAVDVRTNTLIIRDVRE
jgi:type II secretory pathway component HofQ